MGLFLTANRLRLPDTLQIFRYPVRPNRIPKPDFLKKRTIFALEFLGMENKQPIIYSWIALFLAMMQNQGSIRHCKERSNPENGYKLFISCA
jgi:hypothetical protein